ncbi:MAG TPA: asparagine synthase (glutamine-hydrolyzing) [Vicinamibacterales bacterium]|nr:asparagine synthase (glutamine-hydrolyzing) [Vicinamibacterales bacterium]
MCGIAGVVERGAGDTEAVTCAMRDSLGHRGPDGAAVRAWPEHGVGLGHRRLAIIDTGSGGMQPLANEDGTVWVIANGEICNFLSLRRELEALGHRFRSQSDSEVIVHAYEEWGDGHVERLSGFFAFALYDRRPADGRPFRVLLVRDRLGVKPLFYSAARHRVAFGSEIKALLRHPRIDRSIDRTALFDYFTYSCMPGDKTGYAAIRSLPPGHLMVIERDDFRIRQYWDVPVNRTRRISLPEAISDTRLGVAGAVGEYLTSDVPIGVLMSGGIDSGMVAACAAAIVPALPSFALGFDVVERNETAFAASLATALGTSHHEGRADGDALPDWPDTILDAFDQPFADASAVPTAVLSRLAARHVKAVLSGDGGDEVFAGYNRYTSWMSETRPTFDSYARRLELFSPAEKRAWLAPEWSADFSDYDDYWHYRAFWRDDLEPVTRLQYVDLKTYLPDDILVKVDRASMSASLEVRPPLIEHRLVERIVPLPGAQKVRDAVGKRLLKDAARGVIPDTIIDRPKRGFSAPMTNWVVAHQQWAETTLRESRTGLFRPGVTEPAPSRYGEKVWAAILADRWLARHA